jgi:hypothetical protein
MTLENKFEIFHTSKPYVYDMLVELARKMKTKKTMRQWSIYAAYELVRYQWNPHTRTFDDYKLPNEFRPLYSRLIMKQEPDLAGFFRVKGADAVTAESEFHQTTLDELFAEIAE